MNSRQRNSAFTQQKNDPLAPTEAQELNRECAVLVEAEMGLRAQLSALFTFLFILFCVLTIAFMFHQIQLSGASHIRCMDPRSGSGLSESPGTGEKRGKKFRVGAHVVTRFVSWSLCDHVRVCAASPVHQVGSRIGTYPPVPTAPLPVPVIQGNGRSG